VADNGSDMYTTGTFDTRWKNDVLNPAFAALTVSDFEVVKLGWTPAPSTPVTLTGLAVNPSTVVGGSSTTGTVTLSAGAPTGGVSVALSSASSAVASVPASVSVGSGSTSASFTVTTSSVPTPQVVGLTASLDGTDKTAAVTVTPSPPPPPPAL